MQGKQQNAANLVTESPSSVSHNMATNLPAIQSWAPKAQMQMTNFGSNSHSQKVR